MNPVLRLMSLIFGLIGSLFALAAGGVAAYLHTASRGMQAVVGYISSFQMGNPLIAYEIDGTVYHLRASSRNSFQHLGDAYRLLVDPADPAHCVDPQLWVLVLVFGILGGVMLIAACIMRYCAGRQDRRLNELLVTGQRARAMVTEVRVDRSVNVGSRHPVRIVAACVNPVTGQPVTVRSPLRWPGTIVPGQTVDVLFDPLDPGKYAFDLPEETR